MIIVTEQTLLRFLRDFPTGGAIPKVDIDYEFRGMATPSRLTALLKILAESGKVVLLDGDGSEPEAVEMRRWVLIG